MSDDPFRDYIETLRRQIVAQTGEPVGEPSEKMMAVLEELQLIYEEMQTSLEVAEVTQEELLEHNQQVASGYYHYYDLFQSSPVAYLVTDATGMILEANQAIAQLLNIPRSSLTGKPLAVFVAESDRTVFRTYLNQLSQTSGVQHWPIKLCPREREPFLAELHIAIARNPSGLIEVLQIGVYNVSQYQQTLLQLTEQQNLAAIQAETAKPMLLLPQSLDGLQVLVVDDEADAREFITAVLESHGIGVRAVATAAAVLATLETFHPDVLVCDVRMPDLDGYSLIRQIRAWEVQHGRHIPAAAFTAYLEESREKALTAGFEAHLHKLAPPNELIEMVAQLAGRTPSAG